MVERSQPVVNGRKHDDEISDLSLLPFSDEDSSSHDYEEHPLYPYKVWIKWLYDEMVEQGFYSPHLSLDYHCSRVKTNVGNTIGKSFSLSISLRVCAKPPSKIDFMNALYFIASPSIGNDVDEPIKGTGPTLRWI